MLAAGILWGMLGIFVRVLNRYGLEAMEVVMIRSVIAAAVLFLILLFSDRKQLRIRIRDLWCFLGTGIGSIVFFNYCYFTAVSMMSLAAAAVLLYTAPVFVMVLSFFLFHEQITARKWTAIAFTFLGCLLVTGIVGSSARLSAKGILFGLGAGIGYAFYSIFSRFALNRGYSSVTITFYTFLAAAIASSVMTGGWGSAAGAIKTGGSEAILAMLALGVLSTVLAYILYTFGLSRMENSHASVIASIEPVTASIMGVALYHEKLTVWTLLGIALVLGGILIVNIQGRKPDFVAEVVSPSSTRRDRFIKFTKYKNAGVRELWPIEPRRMQVVVYLFEKDDEVHLYSFDDDIPVDISEGKCIVNFHDVKKRMNPEE